MTTGVTLLTAEEYGNLPDDGRFAELVRGEVVEMARPCARRGQIGVQVGYLLRRFLEDHPAGHAIGNNAGVVTERGPDTVRGPDIYYVGYARYPKGPMPKVYVEPADVVFEVRSPSDRWPEIEEKVAEYMTSGVAAVCVIDEEDAAVHVYREGGDITLTGNDELTLPEIHADLRIAVNRFFE